MTKVWKADTENEARYTRASLLNVRDFRGVKTMTGEPLSDRFPGAQIAIDSEQPPADYFTAGPLFIVSDRLLSVLQQFPVRTELHPVKVIARRAVQRSLRYFFVNILDEVDCLDRAASEYIEKGGFAGDISKLVLDESKMAAVHLFRLARASQFVVLVSDSLATAVDCAGVVGVRFVEPSGWRR